MALLWCVQTVLCLLSNVAVLPLVEGKLVNYIEKVFDPLIARSADGVLTVV